MGSVEIFKILESIQGFRLWSTAMIGMYVALQCYTIVVFHYRKIALLGFVRDFMSCFLRPQNECLNFDWHRVSFLVGKLQRYIVSTFGSVHVPQINLTLVVCELVTRGEIFSLNAD